MKLFRIMPSPQRADRLRATPPDFILWDVIAPHEERARLNHGWQSLETLNSRGGLAPCEAVAVLEERPWRAMDYAEACARLTALTAPPLAEKVDGARG